MEQSFNVDQALKQIIVNLIKSREYLGYNLSYALGAIHRKEFDEISNDFLAYDDNDPNLLEKAKLLVGLIPDRIDSDIVSICLNCSLGKAEKLLLEIAANINIK